MSTKAPTKQGRIPPHDLEAEQSVLGAMMLSGEAVAQATEAVKPGDFYREAHRVVYEALVDLYARGEPVDAITAKDELRRRGKLREAGGALYIAHLVETVPTPASAGHYARIVGETARRRRMIAAATNVVDLAFEGVELEDGLRRLTTALNGDGDGRVSTSWAEIDLDPVLKGEALDPPPTILRRTDGQGLIYAGRIHSFAGEPETGKSWAGLAACGEEIQAERPVVFLDFEDHADAVIARLRALGVDDDAIVARFHYVRPDEPLTRPGEIDLAAVLAHAPSLIVVDGVTEAMTLFGLDPLNNGDVARFFERLPRRLAEGGAAVILNDHVVKDGGTRGRWAIGAQHKLAGLDGAAYHFTVVRPFGRGLDGVARVEVAKDRQGFVRQAATGGKVIGELHLRSAEDGSVTVEIRPGQAFDGEGPRPSVRRVLDALEGVEPPGLSVTEIGDRLAEDEKGPPLKRMTIQRVLDELTADGAADGVKPGNGLASRWWVT